MTNYCSSLFSMPYIFIFSIPLTNESIVKLEAELAAMTEEQRAGTSEELQLQANKANLIKMEDMQEEIMQLLEPINYRTFDEREGLLKKSYSAAKMTARCIDLPKKIKDAFKGGWRHDLEDGGKIYEYYRAVKKIEEIKRL